MVLSLLRDEAVANVEERNGALKNGEPRFEIAPGSGANPSFWVVRKVSDHEQPSIHFLLKPDGTIAVERDLKEFVSAKLTLTDDGDCKLKVNGRELERWQFLRLALEDFFF